MAVFPYANTDFAGATVYAQAQPNGLATYANLTNETFEAYQSGHYSQYAVAMVEGAPGLWTGTWPAWFPDGTYYFTVRRRVGGSPASTDPVIGSGTERLGGTSPPPPAAGSAPRLGMVFQTEPPAGPTLASAPAATLKVGETRVGGFNFGTQPEVLAGSTVANGTLASDGAGLAAGAAAVGSNYVYAALTAYTAGTYVLTASAALDDDAGSVVVRTAGATVEVV